MSRPTIYPRSESGLRPANSYSFGSLGDPYAITVHHSAGPRANTKARCQELNRAYQLLHQGKTLKGSTLEALFEGYDLDELAAENYQPDDEELSVGAGNGAAKQGRGWGDIGYHFCMDDLGRWYKLRPVGAKGAHVGGYNSGNIGLMIHGNYDRDELDPRQRESIEWLFKGGIRILTGVSEYDLRFARSHQEWPEQATACPGRNLQRHWKWRRSVAFQ